MNVSVVIATFDRSIGDIYPAIESALKAGCDDVIVVRDGGVIGLLDSCTFVGDTVQEFSGKDALWVVEASDYRVIYTIPCGVVHARNLGIHYAKHDLIVPLDDDDALLPDGLEKLVEAYRPGTLVYGSWIERRIINTTWAGDRPPYEDVQRVLPPPPEMLNRKNLAYATWLFSKSDFYKAGGYDPDFAFAGEDWALMVALAEEGVRPVRIARPIYRRTLHAESRTTLVKQRIEFVKALMKEKYPRTMA